MNNQNQKIGNPNAEKIVLQALLEDYKRVYEYEISEEDFSEDIYKAIFKLLVKYEWNIELVEWECKKAWWIIWEERDTLNTRFSSYITKNLTPCLEEIKQASKRRNMLKIVDKINLNIQMWDQNWVLEEANKLYEMEDIKQQSREDIKREIIDDAFQMWWDIKRYLTCYEDIDSMTGWFYPNQLITIAARPWIWKTLIALNFIWNQLEAWHKVAFFSLEMSTKEIYQRLYARYWELEVNKIKGAKSLDTWDDAKLWYAVDRVWKFEENLVLFDDKHGLWEIVNQIRLLHSKWMVDIVYIDYVGLIEVKAENRNLEISKITRSLKMLAMQLKIPIVILAQLSRAVEKRYWWDEPILSDLRDSWSIEQDSDVVLMLHREDEKCLKVIVRKNRNWPLWPCYQFINPRYMQVWDMTEKEKQLYINND